jgi:hypothetical protein
VQSTAGVEIVGASESGNPTIRGRKHYHEGVCSSIFLTPMVSEQNTVEAAPRMQSDLSIQQACLVLARTLMQLHRPVYALWPVPECPGLGQVPLRLGKALAAFAINVGLVEPRDRWRSGLTTEDRVSVLAASDAVDSLVPVGTTKSSVVAVIEETLAFARGRYSCTLLDLSGLDLVAAHEVALIPEVATLLFVARGQIGEFALARIRRRFPAERLLGAVFMDVQVRRDAA